MCVSRVNAHDYLTLDFTTKGEVKVSMVDYLKGMINDFLETITGAAATPATENLIGVKDDHERTALDETRARAFHHSVAQLLFASSRSRKDIQTAVAFLTTRVRSPDKDERGKLKRVLKYLRGTVYMPLILKAYSLNIVKWWVGASFTTHGDNKGHTGVTMSLGKG
jgi:hypothetical protein